MVLMDSMLVKNHCIAPLPVDGTLVLHHTPAANVPVNILIPDCSSCIHMYLCNKCARLIVPYLTWDSRDGMGQGSGVVLESSYAGFILHSSVSNNVVLQVFVPVEV